MNFSFNFGKQDTNADQLATDKMPYTKQIDSTGRKTSVPNQTNATNVAEMLTSMQPDGSTDPIDEQQKKKKKRRRFVEVVTSKTAKILPTTLQFVNNVEIPEEIDDTNLSGDYVTGSILLTGQQELGEAIIKSKIKKQKNSSAVNLRPKKKKKKQQNIIAKKKKLQAMENEDICQGRVKESLESAQFRSEQQAEHHVMSIYKQERTNTFHIPPQRTTGEYNARNSRDQYMLNSLKKLNKTELEIIRKQPDRNEKAHLKIYQQIQKESPFYEKYVVSFINSDTKVPAPHIVTFNYVNTFLREAIAEKQERQCALQNNCVCNKEFGFICREFLTPVQYERFILAFNKDPRTSGRMLPDETRLCLPDHMASVLDNYHLRVHKANHMDQEGEMETGSTILLDETKVLSDIIFDIHRPGQYNIQKCIGVEDQEWRGLLGAFIAWNPKNYICETKTLIQICNYEEAVQVKLRALKRANARKRAEEESSGGLDDDMYRDTSGKLTFKVPRNIQVVNAGMGTPLPGKRESMKQECNPVTGEKRNKRSQRKIKYLSQRDCLLFREGVMPARIEETTNSTRSILSSCN